MTAGRPQPLHFRGLTLGRLNQFEGGPYGNVTDVLYEQRVDSEEFIKLYRWSVPKLAQVSFSEALAHVDEFEQVDKGDVIGPSWSQHWYKVRLYVPPSMHKKERVQFEFDPGAEGTVYDSEGNVLQGLTGGFSVSRRVDIILDPKKISKPYDLVIEVSCNGMFGNGYPGTNDPPDPNRYYTLRSADLVVPRMEAWALLFDFRVIRDLAYELPERSVLGNLALETGNEILNVFDPSDLSTIPKCRKLAEAVLGEAWEKRIPELFAKDGKNPSGFESWAIGNCHIDTAWLWPYSATRLKTSRSWSSQIDLMKRYPEYKFVASQAQQFAWLEKMFPSLFDEIARFVKQGQFIPVGGTWVECDINMPSGEALIRQIVYGQRFFVSRFGSFSRTFWLPDTFGYSAQLPQIIKLAGMDYFFTQKLSWSQFNDFPHTTFRWVGQDGTPVTTHMTPVNTYTAQANVEDVKNSIANHKSLQSRVSSSLLPFGNGDGGGGPLAQMIESLRRCRSVADTHGELPKVHLGSGVDEFFDNVTERSKAAPATGSGSTLPSWNGELYLELHRATATSHGSIKWGNRKSEILLQQLETIAALTTLHDPHYHYPKAEIDELWEGVLLNQFHDVLPGSGIGLAYKEPEEIYAHVRKRGAQLLQQAKAALLDATSSAVLFPDHWLPNGDDVRLIAFNPSLEARNELVRVPASRQVKGFASQGSHELFWAESQPGSLFAELTPRGNVVTNGIGTITVIDVITLSNSSITITLTKAGRITSIYDKKASLEVLESDAGFVLFQDQPLAWDAWDVDAFHLETPKPLYAASFATTDTSVSFTYEFGGSSIHTTLSLDSLLRFQTHVDWHEKHKFLKFELPTVIQSDFASFENQFGLVRRPTHRNTTWDRAKFEVSAHKFVDLSMFGYGVALLNDSKYGYAADGSTLRISLLRGPTAPDENCDMGPHDFAFAVYPHQGSFDSADVPSAARAFNEPLESHVHLVSIPSPTAQLSLCPVSILGAPNVLLSGIKRGDEDFAPLFRKKAARSLIIRVYEAYGGHARAHLSVGFAYKSAAVVDLLEREITPLEKLDLSFHAFEVKTIRFEL